ncbi:MAG: hypothetical protein ACR2HF_13435 [Methylococcaceae bacterium]
MKVLAGVMVILAIIYFLPAFLRGSDSINGHSRETAYRSAIQVKRYLPTDSRVVFDTAFGILDKIKAEEGPDAFIKAVDGKKPDEIIEMARHEVGVKIATGHPTFKQYTSWDDMIAKLTGDTLKSGKTMSPDQPLRESNREGRPQ